MHDVVVVVARDTAEPGSSREEGLRLLASSPPRLLASSPPRLLASWAATQNIGSPAQQGAD
ncbi:hypothetical protein [Streptomyces aureus]|uniref:hypothetical protein n=1 Tax=Streptomyces aureus TaxID=193461 RepID=UPI0033C1FB39